MINVLNLSIVLYSRSYCKALFNIVISMIVARSISQNYSSWLKCPSLSEKPDTHPSIV